MSARLTTGWGISTSCALEPLLLLCPRAITNSYKCWSMLTLAPFGGLQAALKRRNSSKASIPPSLQQQANGSNYLTLPGNIRRFASTEALSSLSSTSLGIANVNRRRGSLSRRMRKVSPAVSQTLPDLTTVCLQLDLHIAKIKKTLVCLIH